MVLTTYIKLENEVFNLQYISNLLIQCFKRTVDSGKGAKRQNLKYGAYESVTEAVLLLDIW